MDISEYNRNLDDAVECGIDNANDEISCTSRKLPKLTIGASPVGNYLLNFYKHRLIVIVYSVTVAMGDDEAFRNAFIEKFGQPDMSSGVVGWKWYNSTSSMTILDSDNVATIIIQLDKENAELY